LTVTLSGSHFAPQETDHNTLLIIDWMGQKASVEVVEKGKIPASPRNQVLCTQFSCLYPVLSELLCLYTRKSNEESDNAVSAQHIHKANKVTNDGRYRNNLIHSYI
jgi:hypothetical protein